MNNITGLKQPQQMTPQSEKFSSFDPVKRQNQELKEIATLKAEPTQRPARPPHHEKEAPKESSSKRVDIKA